MGKVTLLALEKNGESVGAGTFCRKSWSKQATGKERGRGCIWAKSHKAEELKQEESF